MTLEQLIALCNPIRVSGPQPAKIGALTQDSREVTGGSVFIAVKGTRVDGHKFIDDAISCGAGVIICEEVVSHKQNVCFVEVKDTRSLIGPLAQAFQNNPAKHLTLIGITGTNGKTTVATLVYQVLAQLGARPALLGTIEKRFGDEVMDSRLTTSDPIELARDMRRMAEVGSTHLVMEVSSHALEQQRTAGLDFAVAAFTNLSHDHLDYHSGFEDYAQTKKLLFDGLRSDAHAVINADDRYAELMTEDCSAQVTKFGFLEDAGIPCRVISSTTEGLTLTIGKTEITSPLVGTFNAYNIAEAFIICRTLGYEETAVAVALSSAAGAAGRMERILFEDTGAPVVLVDYAHTPDALENVLVTLSELKTEDQILHVVFGCGGNRDKAKRPKMASVSEKYADRVTITSDNPRDEDPDAIIDDAMKGFRYPDSIIRISNRKEAIEQAVAKADANTILLIAGKGHETYQEINGVRRHFDDREIARKALGEPAANTSPEGGV